MRKTWTTESFRELRLPQGMVKVDEDHFLYEEKRIDEKQEYRSSLILKELSTGKESFITEGTDASCLVTDQGIRISFWRGDELFWQKLQSDGTGGPYSIGTYRNHSRAEWSPDGRRLVFTAAVKQLQTPQDLPALQAVTWVDRLQFKSDASGIYDGSYREVLVYDTDREQLEEITYGHCDYSNACFLGKNVVTATAVLNKTDASDAADFIFHDLMTGEERSVAGPGGPITEICPAPEGEEFLFLSHQNTYWEATNFRIYRCRFWSMQEINYEEITLPLDRSMGNYVIVDSGLKKSAASLRYGKNSSEIYALYTDGYRTKICCIQGDRIIKTVEDDQVILEYQVFAEKLLLLKTGLNLVAGLYLGEQTIWEKNETYQEIKATPFSYTGYDGTLRQGYVMQQGDMECKGIVLDIHGGPHFCHGLAFSVDVHCLAQAGYAVVYCNPAGSQGAGEALTRASYHDWGGKDYRELMNVVLAVDKLSQFVGKSLKWAVKGGSYGGYMVNWIIGHEDKFACAISERSTCNRYSQAGTSDCAFRYGKFEFDGFPWEHTEHYMEKSPITYVKKINTPVLLIHGEKDRNCPIEQSEEFFSALRLEEKEAYFARFPGQNHSFSITGTPSARQDRYQLLVWWMDRYMQQSV